MNNKNDIIKNVYYDRSGFGNIKNTFDDARKIDNTIKIDDVKQWFKENLEKKTQLKGFNSFVAPYNNYEYQFDLFFINDLENQEYKVGAAMIDIFSKYLVVVPIKSKSEKTGDIAHGLLECLHKMGHKPEIIYTDDEKGLDTEAMNKYFKDNNIKHVITRSHPWFIERAIRTFKDALYKRIENSKEENVQWTNFIYEILLTYNNKLKHSSTNFTPSEARKEHNELHVRLNLLLNKNHTRKYPLLQIGDKVKIFRKKKINEKERTSKWSNEIYEVEDIIKSLGQHFFKLKNDTRHYIRADLLKI